MTMTEPTVHQPLVAADPRDGLPPMLWGYAMIHDAILRDAGRLPEALGRVRHRADVDRMSGWLQLFETAIVHHHEREDDLIFPLLAERIGFNAGELTADHHVLDELFRELIGATDMMRSAPETTDHSIRAAVAVATELDQVMVRHLHEEELAVFPVITRHVEVEEWRAIEQEIQKDSSLRDAAFALPWVLEGAKPAYVDHLRDDLPLPFRIINALFWRRAYDRIAAPLQAVVS